MMLKICGIRRPEDVAFLNENPPDFAGFILSKPFWRYVPPEEFRRLVLALDGKIGRVGVFVNPTMEEIYQYVDYLQVIQLHGEETADFIQEIREKTSHDIQIWKAARVRTPEDIRAADALPVDKLVLDSFSTAQHGGTGELAPWQLIAENRPEKPFFLAGGISAGNVREAASAVNPFGVDASSSVETEKCKDSGKIQELVSLVRAI